MYCNVVHLSGAIRKWRHATSIYRSYFYIIFFIIIAFRDQKCNLPLLTHYRISEKCKIDLIAYGRFSKFYQKIVILIFCFQKFVLNYVIHNEWKQTYPRWEIFSYFLNLKTRSLYDVWVKKYKQNAKGQKMRKKVSLLMSNIVSWAIKSWQSGHSHFIFYEGEHVDGLRPFHITESLKRYLGARYEQILA